MMRKRRSWHAPFQRSHAHGYSARQNISHPAHHRLLRIEPLEDRRLLAVFTVDNLDDAGLGSLRQAIADANANIGADTVEFQAGLSGTIALLTGEMLITDDLTIDGPGADVLIIDAQQNSRIFHITPTSGPVTFEGLFLTGGKVTSTMNAKGGAILSETSAPLSINESTITGNSVRSVSIGAGGGIYSYGDVTATDSAIFDNSATGILSFGGGIFAGRVVTVTPSTISGNSSAGDISAGVGIYASGDVTVTGSTISGNSATGISAGFGGGIFTHGDVIVSKTTISGNSAMGNDYGGGGGISAGGVTVTSSTISGNSAAAGNSAFGGGISAGGVTVTSSTISGNSAAGHGRARGGGIIAGGDVTVTSSTISGNSATGHFFGAGGGVRTSGDVTVTNSTISGNSATAEAFDDSAYGGGISSLGDVTVVNSTISGNSATGRFQTAGGGGIYADFVIITSSTISGNSAIAGFSARGGGVRAFGDVAVTDSTISGNSARGGFAASGGGIHAKGVMVTRSTISRNLATGGPLFSDLASGGGIWVEDGPVTIENSIVADNHLVNGITRDLRPGTGPLTVRYSLIGDNTGTGLAPGPVGMPDANGNLIGTAASPIDPLLGPLLDNGGPTFTHALLPGSPAINAGDPNFAPPPDFDQRGDPFVRVSGGRIDMGAFELQSATLDEKIQQLLDTGVLNRGQANSLLVKLNSASNERAQLNRLSVFSNEVNAFVRAGILSAEEGQCLIDAAESLRASISNLGDANGDGLVNAGDYTLWANQFDTPGPGQSADFNSDGVVNAGDYTLWANNFGVGVATSVAPAAAPLAVLEDRDSNEVESSTLAIDRVHGSAEMNWALYMLFDDLLDDETDE